MATPYDISTVVSRSYIPEQLQDSMQKGQEQKNAMFLAEFQKEFEKKQQEVGKAIKAESAGVAEKAIKFEEEKMLKYNPANLFKNRKNLGKNFWIIF